MAEHVNSGDKAVVRLLSRAWHALVGRGPGRKPAKTNGPLTMSDIHPPGSCARTALPPDFSDLFAPETPDVEENKR